MSLRFRLNAIITLLIILMIGAGIGQAGIKDNINTGTFDANDAAYKAFIGWRFKVPVVNFAVEGAYTDFGKPSQTLGAQRVETKLHGPSLAGLVILPLGPFDLYGKGGAIKRITQRLNPRVCRVVALPAPNDRERPQ